MTTITTTSHQRTPLIAAIAAGSALVAGIAIGAVWEKKDTPSASTDTPPATHSLSITHDPFGGATTSEEISGSVTGHLSHPTRFGGATTSQESTQ